VKTALCVGLIILPVFHQNDIMKGISVIIPVYNREAFLEEAIQSVLDQNYEGDLEIIVSDDGSTDHSLEIASSFGNQVLLLRKPEGCMSQGVSGTRNRGIAAATQPYVAFLDSDDFYLPNHLNRMVAALESRQELGFVFSRTLQMKEEDGRKLFAPWTRTKVTKRDILYPVISGSYVVNTNAFLFRRAVFEMVGVFNESYTNYEDSDMWLRISEQYKGGFSDHNGAVYRIEHDLSQLTDKNNQDKIRRCSKCIYTDALVRCQLQSKRDSYRLFRLRLTLAYYNNPIWLALLSVAIHHPVYFLLTVISSRRVFKRFRPLEYQELAGFLDID
jgi:glycosyltransferase involved in cell wall biosynthesis